MSRLYGLDALRGFAALIVFGHHVLGTYGFPNSQTAAVLCVDLFFMLSGFILMRTYGSRFEQGLSGRQFIYARYKRLWMPVSIGTALGLVATYAAGELTLGIAASAIATALFLPAIWLRFFFPLNFPIWSLFSEIFANAVHATFKKTPPFYLIAIFAPGYLITTVWAGGHVYGMNAISLGPSLLRAVTVYFIGAQLYASFGDKPLVRQPLTVIFGMPLGVALCATLLPPTIGGILFVTTICPLLLRGSLGLGRQRWAMAAGAISFPLYAVHAPALELMRGQPIWVSTICTVLIAVTVACVTETWPGRRLTRENPIRARRICVGKAGDSPIPEPAHVVSGIEDRKIRRCIH